MVYEQYGWRSEYEGLPLRRCGFAIIEGTVEGRPAVCIRQHNGKGYLFDLPGGGMDDATDADVRKVMVREVEKQVKVRCRIMAAIGLPLYHFIKKVEVPIRVDCVQAFLVQARNKPTPGEALAVAFVNEKSFAGFNLVGRTPDPPTFGRTPIPRIFDGLSVLQEPFWTGALTDNLRRYIVGDPDLDSCDFLLLDGGAYFGRTFIATRSQEKRQGRLRIALYRRLNPDQPHGYFSGSLDRLASVSVIHPDASTDEQIEAALAFNRNMDRRDERIFQESGYGGG